MLQYFSIVLASVVLACYPAVHDLFRDLVLKRLRRSPFKRFVAETGFVIGFMSVVLIAIQLCLVIPAIVETRAETMKQMQQASSQLMEQRLEEQRQQVASQSYGLPITDDGKHFVGKVFVPNEIILSSDQKNLFFLNEDGKFYKFNVAFSLFQDDITPFIPKIGQRYLVVKDDDRGVHFKQVEQ